MVATGTKTTRTTAQMARTASTARTGKTRNGVGKVSMTQEDPQRGQERWATDDDPGAAGKGKGEARMRRTHAPLAALLESEAARLFIFSSCPPLP